jgi:hypothetical protein
MARPRRLHLTAEAPPEVGVVGQVAPDHLDRHQKLVGRPGQIDAAHAALAEAFE